MPFLVAGKYSFWTAYFGRLLPLRVFADVPEKAQDFCGFDKESRQDPAGKINCEEEGSLKSRRLVLCLLREAVSKGKNY